MKKYIFLIGFASLLVLIYLFIKLTNGFIPVPIGIRHFVNASIGYKDLYDPIIKDQFLFCTDGFSKTYSFNPKYLDIYEIGILFNNDGIDSAYKFKGKLKAEFFIKDELIISDIITSQQERWYADNAMEKIKQVSLYKFDVPVQKKHINNLKIKLMVIEADENLKEFTDSTIFYVAVSAAP